MLPPDVRALTREVSNALGSIGSGEPVEMAWYYRDIMGIFDRCRSGLGAVRLLAEQGFSHEALSLGRQLFTESLVLADLAAGTEADRLKIMSGWTLEGLSSWEGIFMEAHASQGKDTREELAAVRSALGAVRLRARRAGTKVRPWKPHEKQLAARHGRTAEYLDFLVSHHFVHGSSFAVALRSSMAADETVLVGGPAADTRVWAIIAALFACDSTLFAASAACAIFTWSEPPQLVELRERVERLADSYEESALAQ